MIQSENTVRHDVDEVCEVVKRFMDSYIRNNVGYMLTGSYATGQANETSDLDVVVICKYTRTIFIESFDFEGFKIQVIGLPLLDIDYIIYRDTKIRKGVYLHQLASGIILSDKRGILGTLKKKCSEIFCKGPQKLSETEIKNLRGKITTRIEDLRGDSDPDDLFYIAVELLQLLVEAIFNINQKWLFSGKSAGRILKKEFPGFHQQMKDSYREVAEGNRAALLGLSCSLVNSIGGELHFTSTSLCTSMAITDYLNIFIPTGADSVKHRISGALCQQFIKYMMTVAPKYGWIRIDWLNEQYPGIFLICHASKDIINDELIPLVDMFSKSLDRTSLAIQASSMSYPYYISPLESFYGEVLKKNVFRLIENLQKNRMVNIHPAILYNILKYFKIRIQEYDCGNEIWKHIVEMYDQNFIYRNSMNPAVILSENIADSLSEYSLKDTVSALIENVVSGCMTYHRQSLLIGLEAQTQSLYRVIRILESIFPDIDFYSIIKTI